jgi:hypothetical protein
MRKYYYKPEAQDNLDKLDALIDIEAINKVVEDLAADRKMGTLVPLQGPDLSPQEKLYQYQVGRYKLNYTLTRKELNVVSVMV